VFRVLALLPRKKEEQKEVRVREAGNRISGLREQNVAGSIYFA
jgi:hypothetical protein